jgi:hypothetical protein
MAMNWFLRSLACRAPFQLFELPAQALVGVAELPVELLQLGADPGGLGLRPPPHGEDRRDGARSVANGPHDDPEARAGIRRQGLDHGGLRAAAERGLDGPVQGLAHVLRELVEFLTAVPVRQAERGAGQGVAAQDGAVERDEQGRSGSAASKAGASIVAVDGVRERVDDGNGDLLGSSFSLGP